jgi:hypothetical protein
VILTHRRLGADRDEWEFRNKATQQGKLPQMAHTLVQKIHIMRLGTQHPQ